MWWCLLVVSFAAPSVERLEDFERSLDRAERLLTHAQAAQDALAEVQRVWFAEGCGKGECSDLRRKELLLDSRSHGARYRDFLQSARMEKDRAMQLSDVSTVRPLIEGRRAKRLDAVIEGVAREEGRYLGRVAWQETYVERSPAVRPWRRR